VRNCGLWSDGRDDDGFVWALRIRTGNREWLAEARRHNDLLSRTVPLAVELWHEPCVSLRDGNELLCICGRCSALGYGDAAEGVVGGALGPRSWTPRRRPSLSVCHPDPAAAGRGERVMPRTPCQNRRARSGSSAGNSISGAGTDRVWLALALASPLRE
jgi:hypothetical protein